MKALLLLLVLISSYAFAQVENPDENPTENPVNQGPKSQPSKPSKDETYGEAPIGVLEVGSANWLKKVAYRLHTLDLGAAVKEMKRDGVSGRNFVAVFSAEGALIYGHEDYYTQDGYNFPKYGRDVGHEMLAFKVKLESDGSVKARISLYAHRNLSEQTKKRSMWNHVEWVNIEYNWELARQIREVRVAVIDVGIKLALVKTENDKFIIGIKAGFAAGWHMTQFKNVEIYPGEKEYFMSGVNADLVYGMFFSYTSNNGWQLEGGIDLRGRFDFNDPSESSQDPVDSRYTIHAKPYLALSKRLSSPTESRVRMGLRIEGNYLIYDKLNKGSSTEDLKKLGMGELVSGTAFLNW